MVAQPCSLLLLYPSIEVSSLALLAVLVVGAASACMSCTNSESGECGNNHHHEQRIPPQPADDISCHIRFA
jgi:hypothetical protein